MYLPRLLGRGVPKNLRRPGGEYAYLSRPRESYRPKVERLLNPRLWMPSLYLVRFPYHAWLQFITNKYEK